MHTVERLLTTFLMSWDDFVKERHILYAAMTSFSVEIIQCIHSKNLIDWAAFDFDQYYPPDQTSMYSLTSF